jgi:hypothetical protein
MQHNHVHARMSSCMLAAMLPCFALLAWLDGDRHDVLKLICRRTDDSDILKVTLPRPMGLVFEEDKAKGQVVVADFVEGSEAEKRNKVSIFCLRLSEQCLLYKCLL